MAVITGFLETGFAIFTAYTNPAIGNNVPPVLNLADDISSAFFGTSTDTQPVDEPENTHTGFESPMFGFLHWYNHIHIQFAELDLGAVVSSQEVPFYIFNAFFVNRTLNDIIITNGDGLVVVSPVAGPPTVFAPLQELTYILQASADGPATIDAVITFDFDNRDYEMDVTGTRVIAWRWTPNWANGIRERLEWQTDAMISYNAKEQRRQLRINPRQFFEFTVDIEGQQRRIFENALYNWGARLWALPVWPDVARLMTTLADGVTTIPVSTATKSFTVGELIMLIAHDDSNHEALEITAVNANDVATTTPTVNEWGPGTKVYPARLASLESPFQLSAFFRNYGYGVASFRCDKGTTYTAATESVIYRTYPVLVDPPDGRNDDPSVGYERKAVDVDGQIGLIETVDEALIPYQIFGYRWMLLSRADVDYFRKFLFARKGRFKGMWVPTFTDDLIVVVTIGSAATNVDFEYAGLVSYAEGGVHRRDIRIKLKDGTIFYRRVSAPQTISPTVERMSIDTALGVTVDPEDVEMVSWMSLARLDSDSIEISWDAPHVAESVTVFRGYNSDV